MFIIIDGSTQGKDPEKVNWFINEIGKFRKIAVDEKAMELLLK